MIYMAKLEADRKWNVPALRHDHVFLRGFAVRRKDSSARRFAPVTSSSP